MPEESHFWNGAWRKATDLWVWDGSVWRSLKDLHVWDGSVWRRCFNSVVAPTLQSSSGAVVAAFEWTLSYTLSASAPTGFNLSVIAGSGSGLEAGPFDISATTTGTRTVATDSTDTYRVQLRNDLDDPVGSFIDVTPV